MKEYITEPKLIAEWHSTKNGQLVPTDLPIGSRQKVFWVCGKGHEWETQIRSRARYGTGCPYCANKLVSAENNLMIVYPEVANEWHPELNGELRPIDVTHGSEKRVWWRCRYGHEWQAVV